MDLPPDRNTIRGIVDFHTGRGQLILVDKEALIRELEERELRTQGRAYRVMYDVMVEDERNS